MINALSVTPDSMNPALQRIHRIFAVIFGVIVFPALAIGIVGGAIQLISGTYQGFIDTFLSGVLVAVICAPFFLAHWFAALGAKLGKNYGRNISKIIAFFWLFGFPIGTILAFYVFPKTFDAKWNKPVVDTSKGGLSAGM